MRKLKEKPDNGNATDGGPLTLGSLFDGIGVFPLAASRHGIVPRWGSLQSKVFSGGKSTKG